MHCLRNSTVRREIGQFLGLTVPVKRENSVCVIRNYLHTHLGVGPSKVNNVTVLPIVINKFKPKYSEQNLV